MRNLLRRILFLFEEMVFCDSFSFLMCQSIAWISSQILIILLGWLTLAVVSCSFYWSKRLNTGKPNSTSTKTLRKTKFLTLDGARFEWTNPSSYWSKFCKYKENYWSRDILLHHLISNKHYYCKVCRSNWKFKNIEVRGRTKLWKK